MKKRGFTLIELLAVIVVLAIISTIVMPMMTGVIEKVRKAAAKDGAINYVRAIELKVATDSLSGINYPNKDDYAYDEIDTKAKGSLPTGGIYSLYNNQVTTGTFCINGYVVIYQDNKAEVGEKCNGEDLKLSSILRLSKTSTFLTYPDQEEIEITENTSGGTLSCSTGDSSIVTCEISENKVIVKSGKKEGHTTITLTSAETSKYKEANAAILVSTEQGLLSITSSGYNNTYDGEEHGITVTSSGSLVMYGTEEGTYNLETSPKYTDVGEYTVYYEVTKEGYKTVRGSKTVNITKANGKLTLESTSGSVAYNEEKKVNITESTGELSVSVVDSTIASAKIENGKLVIKGLNTGTTTINVVSASTHNYKEKTVTYQVTVTKANNTLTLSATTGTVTYPGSITFDVVENVSGGALSCASSDTASATCSISGNTVTVKAGTKEATYTTITVTSASTTNYNSASRAFVVTSENGLLSVSANGYTGVYDGEEHGISVSASGATIKYGTTNGTYNLTSTPKYTNVGEYTVYYEVTKEGYKTVTGSKIVKITKANGSVTAPTAKSLTYTGSAQALVNAGSSTTGTIQYKLGDGEYSTTIPTATDDGTYTVYYKVVGDNNHNDVAEKSISVTIGKATMNYTASGYTGVYDGNAHGISVTAPNATIKYGTANGTYNLDASPTYTDVGTYTVYYQITRKGYITVTESKTITITKASGSVKLSANTGSVTYPNSITFEITENKSNGTLSCTSADTASATCSISGNVVTVTAGTKEASSVTLTIKSAATKNYTEASAAYVATSENGLLSVTASDYNAAYDGNAHGITVTSSGATIKYGAASGTYNLDSSPTLTNVGTKTVYYQVTKTGYKTVTGSKTITITKANGSVTAPTAKTLTYTGSAQALINAGSSSTGTIQYKLGTGSYSTTIPTATAAGTYTVYYKVVGDSNHKDVAEASVSVTINKANGSVTAPTAKALTYTGSAQALVNAGSSSTGTIQYKLGTGSYSTSIPTATAPGTYTVYYKVVGDSNHKDVAEASVSVTINKANNTLTLSANTGSITYPTAGTFTVTKNTSGGTLSCSSSNTSAATCSISGTTVTVTPGTTAASSVNIVVKSAATANYKEATATYVVTNNLGTLSVTANGYTGVYDGNAHGISVISSGATIKYGTTSGTYNLTASPTYTNVGTYTVYYQVTKEGYKTVRGSKTVIITSPPLSQEVQVGDIIKMTPTQTSYTISPSLTGMSEYTGAASPQSTIKTAGQTINPSLMKYWRVININTDGTIEVVAEYVQTDTSGNDIYFYGPTGYQKFVGTLNTIAAQYYNDTYTVSSHTAPYFREIGYNGQTANLSSTPTTANSGTTTTPALTAGTLGQEYNGGYTGDTLYAKDLKLLGIAKGVTTADGNPDTTDEKNALIAYKLDTSGNASTTAANYWLASRIYDYSSYYISSSANYWNGRSIHASGSVIYFGLFSYIGAFYNGSAIRPIITLKSGISASSGDGKSISTAWNLG